MWRSRICSRDSNFWNQSPLFCFMFSIFFKENDTFVYSTHQIYNHVYIFLLAHSLFYYSRCFRLTGLYLAITTEAAGTDSLPHTLTCPTRHLGQQQPVLPSHKQIEETAPCFPSTIFPLDNISCKTKHQLLGLLLSRWGKAWPPGTKGHLWLQHIPLSANSLPSHFLVRKQFRHLNINSQWHCRFFFFWFEAFKWQIRWVYRRPGPLRSQRKYLMALKIALGAYIRPFLVVIKLYHCLSLMNRRRNEFVANLSGRILYVFCSNTLDLARMAQNFCAIFTENSD